MANGAGALIDAALTPQFAKRVQGYPRQNRLKILNFIRHLQSFGFDNLPGRNKPSDDISKDSPDFIGVVRFVREHCLWHYHIGIHEYELGTPHGDQTSMFVLHYSRKRPDFVRVVHMSAHPPFEQPTIEMVTY